MYPECEVSVIDIHTKGTLVHCSITPGWSLLRANLPASLAWVVITILHVMELHVCLVVLVKAEY